MLLALARLEEITGTKFRFTGDVQVEVGGGWRDTRIVPDQPSKRLKDGELYPAGVKVNYHPFVGRRRRANAACYHAHGHFMRALFDMNPEGEIKTAVSRYKGVDGFEKNAYALGYRNVGSRMHPVQYRECCDCFEHGKDRF